MAELITHIMYQYAIMYFKIEWNLAKVLECSLSTIISTVSSPISCHTSCCACEKVSWDRINIDLSVQKLAASSHQRVINNAISSTEYTVTVSSNQTPIYAQVESVWSMWHEDTWIVPLKYKVISYQFHLHKLRRHNEQVGSKDHGTMGSQLEKYRGKSAQLPPLWLWFTTNELEQPWKISTKYGDFGYFGQVTVSNHHDPRRGGDFVIHLAASRRRKVWRIPGTNCTYLVSFHQLINRYRNNR